MFAKKKIATDNLIVIQYCKYVEKFVSCFVKIAKQSYTNFYKTYKDK